MFLLLSFILLFLFVYNFSFIIFVFHSSLHCPWCGTMDSSLLACWLVGGSLWNAGFVLFYFFFFGFLKFQIEFTTAFTQTIHRHRQQHTGSRKPNEKKAEYFCISITFSWGHNEWMEKKTMNKNSNENEKNHKPYVQLYADVQQMLVYVYVIHTNTLLQNKCKPFYMVFVLFLSLSFFFWLIIAVKVN